MRQSQLFTKTRREAPKDEEAKNAQLLIRAGFVHKEMAGVYAYLPLGLRVVENIKRIVREEMDAIGGQEMIMTALQRKDVWEQTDRWVLRWDCAAVLARPGIQGLGARGEDRFLRRRSSTANVSRRCNPPADC